MHSRRIAEILDGFGEAFIAFDFDWRIVHCNRAAERHFGFRREDVLGGVIWDLVPGKGGRLHSFLTAAMESRHSSDAEMPSDLHPGRWLSMRAFPLETGLGVSFRDVTERRERTRREREQTERLELALAAAGLGDWSWSAETNHFTLSPVAAAVWGLSAKDGLSWAAMAKCVHPDDRDAVRRAFRGALASRRGYDIEHRIVRPGDGEVRWVLIRARAEQDDEGRPVRILGVIGDITRARSEAARAAADRERLAQLEHRRAFLLEVSDTLRDIDDPAEMTAAAARLVGERLGLSRCGYAEITEDGQHLGVGRDWSDGLPRLEGATFRLDDFGPDLVAELRAGHSFTVADVQSDVRAAPFREAYAAVGIRAILAAPVVQSGRFDAFFCLTHHEPRAWSDEDIALAQDVAARTWSSLARARTQRALQESEARFRTMADGAPAPIWMTNPAGAMAFVNLAFAEIVGLPKEELYGDAWIALMHPEDRPRVGAIRAEGRRDLKGYRFDARFLRHDGEWRWMRASSQPRFDAAGEFQGYVGIATDVTDQRRAEERQRLLINELNHRVKNTLATVQSLAHQTLREGVAREARTRLTDRLLALSAAHNVLTRQNWEAADVAEIVREAVRPYDDPRSPRIRADGPATRVAPNVALALSMALHELATNAVKYGALSAPRGRVDLAWTAADGRLALEWRETGGPPVREPPTLGFGSRLLTQGLATELGAPADIGYASDGLVCRLKAPTA